MSAPCERLYRLAGGWAFDRAVSPAVDTAAMSATAVISTPAPDRAADVVLPAGVQLANYRRNPIVLWEHGLTGLTLPIAKSESPTGELGVTVSEAGITATAWFTSSMPESEQIFALIAEGILRGASIRARPLVTRPRRTPEGAAGVVLESWDLEEWSWVAVPANPEAVAQVLARKTKLCDAVRKSLAASVEPRGTQVSGWREEATSPKSEEPNPKSEKESLPRVGRTLHWLATLQPAERGLLRSALSELLHAEAPAATTPTPVAPPAAEPVVAPAPPPTIPLVFLSQLSRLEAQAASVLSLLPARPQRHSRR